MSISWEDAFQFASHEDWDGHLGSVAAHEAGHAVGWWWIDRSGFMGRRFVCPTIREVRVALDGVFIEADGTAGVSSTSSTLITPGELLPSEIPPNSFIKDPTRYGRLQRRRAKGDIIHIMCGPIAQFLHDGASIKDAWEWLGVADHDEDVDGSDGLEVERRIRYLGRRWRLHFTRAFELADRVVRNHRPYIRALASELVARGRVDGEDVYTLFERVGF